MTRRRRFTLKWTLETPTGIEVAPAVWNTGSVNSVYPLSGDRLLVATQTGGLWMSEPDEGSYGNYCLSDSWDHSGFTVCTPDPANAKKVFVGCNASVSGSTGVYIGDFATSPATWTYLPLPASISDDSSRPTSNAHFGPSAMIILPQQRLLVVGTQLGIGWLNIDNQPYVWNTSTQSVSDMANVAGDDFVFIAESKVHLGPMWKKGHISGDVFTSEEIPDNAFNWKKRPLHPPKVAIPRRVSSCGGDRLHLYCIADLQWETAQRLGIARSHDGGDTWQECSYVVNSSSLSLEGVLKYVRFEGNSLFGLAVNSDNPNIVAAGLGGAAISHDGGQTWDSLNDHAGFHDDIHELVFHLGPRPKSTKKTNAQRPYSLYIPSDGGILRFTGGIGDSRRNRTLPIVELYAPDQPDVFGNLCALGDVIVAGSQDNANLWTDRASNVWRRVAGTGDGGAVALSNQSVYPVVLHSQSFNKLPVRWAMRQDATSWGKSDFVPIRLSPIALDGTGLLPVFLRPVPPEMNLTAGAEMAPVIAIASGKNSNVVYAAVMITVPAPGGSVMVRVEWVAFGQIPNGEFVSSLEPHDSSSVLVGTESGRLFLLKENQTPSEAIFKQKPVHGIRGIAYDGATILCFEASGNPYTSGNPCLLYSSGAYKSRPGSKHAPFAAMHQLDSAIFPPNAHSSAIHAVSANRSTKHKMISFAITGDHEVWLKTSSEKNWRRAVAGLPFAVNCRDVTFVDGQHTGELLLSTYGRGVWRLTF